MHLVMQSIVCPLNDDFALTAEPLGDIPAWKVTERTDCSLKVDSVGSA